MALSTAEAAELNSLNATAQKVALGTEIAGSQATIALIQVGQGITLPTSDPGVAGYLWSDSGTVKVSAGT